MLLSGVVYTARDQAHKRMLEALDKGEKLPFDLEGSAIYYVGPTPERPGEVIGSAGPTTSGRMDAMSPRLLDLGNKIMIGKGKRDAAVKEAVVRNGAVYLAALGGAGALMAQSVQTLEVIAWPDLGCEAVRRLTVEKMPLTVILDAHGGDLYDGRPGGLSRDGKVTKLRRVEFGLIRQTFCEWLATRYGMWYPITNQTGTPVCPGQGILRGRRPTKPCRSTNPQKIILRLSLC